MLTCVCWFFIFIFFFRLLFKYLLPATCTFLLPIPLALDRREHKDKIYRRRRHVVRRKRLWSRCYVSSTSFPQPSPRYLYAQHLAHSSSHSNRSPRKFRERQNVVWLLAFAPYRFRVAVRPATVGRFFVDEDQIKKGGEIVRWKHLPALSVGFRQSVAGKCVCARHAFSDLHGEPGRRRKRLRPQRQETGTSVPGVDLDTTGAPGIFFLFWRMTRSLWVDFCTKKKKTPFGRTHR